MTLQHYKPDGHGGIEPRPTVDPNWRAQLRSPRWGASLRGGKLPALENPEMNPTSSWVSVVFWVVLAVVTFALLVAGYGTGFWH